MRSPHFSLLALGGILLVGTLSCHAQDSITGAPSKSGNSSTSSKSTGPTVTAPLIMATDPGYRLSFGDEISIMVHGEEDISTAQRIDKKGIVRMPLIDEITLADKTVREAETFIEALLVEKKLLKKPLVNITVRDYAVREIVISGTGLSPGVFPLPRETASIEIVELVNRLGGFKPTAKSNAVKIIRTDDTGKDTTQTVDVEAMLNNKKNATKSFLIYPGDRIFVDERLF